MCNNLERYHKQEWDDSETIFPVNLSCDGEGHISLAVQDHNTKAQHTTQNMSLFGCELFCWCFITNHWIDGIDLPVTLCGVMPWWRHQMETVSALLALCAGNSPVTGEFPAQRPVTRSYDAFFDLRLNKGLSKQLWGWWLETPTGPLRRHCNAERVSVLWGHQSLISKTSPALITQECMKSRRYTKGL